MKGSLYTLSYAAILGTVCALLLTGANNIAGPYKAANSKAEEIVNILSALKVPFEEGVSSKELVQIFDKNVRQERRGEMDVYIFSPLESKGETQAIAVRFWGPGLWGPIKGFLALEPDMETIRGMTIYEQEETPGLGGEIGSSWFKEQFSGKLVVAQSGQAGIVIRAGGASLPNGVDAITGATMTCDKLEAMLNRVIKTIKEGQE